jgi:hypothetical protein
LVPRLLLENAAVAKLGFGPPERKSEEIIERVDLWYGALFPTLIANGPGGSNPDRTRAKQ